MFDSGIKTTNCLRNMLSFKTMVTTISIESYNLKDKSEAMASINLPP